MANKKVGVRLQYEYPLYSLCKPSFLATPDVSRILGRKEGRGWGSGVHLVIFVGGVWFGSPNPDPFSDQSGIFRYPFSDMASKFRTRTIFSLGLCNPIYLFCKIHTLSDFQTKMVKIRTHFQIKNHTLWLGTYLYSSYRGIVPPPQSPRPCQTAIALTANL